ncbi:hypothetical protein ABPG74_005383 [Tetrahymena malaccensis]
MDQKIEALSKQKIQFPSLLFSQVSVEENKSQKEATELQFYISCQKQRFEIEQNKPHQAHEGDIQISFQTILGEMNESFQKSFKEINNNNNLATNKGFQPLRQNSPLSIYLNEEQVGCQSQSKYSKIQQDHKKVELLEDQKIECSLSQEMSMQKPNQYRQDKKGSSTFEQVKQFSLDSNINESEFKRSSCNTQQNDQNPYKSNKMKIQDEMIYEKNIKKLGTKVNTVLKVQYQNQNQSKTEEKYQQNFENATNIINRLLNNSMSRIMRIRQNVQNFVQNLKNRYQKRRFCDLSEQEYQTINDLSYFFSQKKLKTRHTYKICILISRILKYSQQFAIFMPTDTLRVVWDRFDYIFTLTENQKHISKLINQLASVITVAHIAAIGWYFLGIQEQNYFQQLNWLDKLGISSDSYYQKYIYSFYWSITTMTTENNEKFLMMAQDQSIITDCMLSQYENDDDDEDEYEYGVESQNQISQKIEEKAGETCQKVQKKAYQSEKIEKQTKSINQENSFLTNAEDPDQLANLENQILNQNSNLIYENQEFAKVVSITPNSQAIIKSIEATECIDLTNFQETPNFVQIKSGYSTEPNKVFYKKDTTAEIQSSALNQDDDEEKLIQTNSRKIDKQKQVQPNLNLQLTDYLKSQIIQGPYYNNLNNQVQKQLTSSSIDDHSQNQCQDNQIQKTIKVDNGQIKLKNNRLSNAKRESTKVNQLKNQSQKELRCSVEQMLLQNIISMTLAQDKRQSQLQQKINETNQDKVGRFSASNHFQNEIIEKKSSQQIGQYQLK